MGISPVHFLAGAVAGTAEHCGMYPVDTIKVRLNASSNDHHAIAFYIFHILFVPLRENSSEWTSQVTLWSSQDASEIFFGWDSAPARGSTRFRLEAGFSPHASISIAATNIAELLDSYTSATNWQPRHHGDYERRCFSRRISWPLYGTLGSRCRCRYVPTFFSLFFSHGKTALYTYFLSNKYTMRFDIVRLQQMPIPDLYDRPLASFSLPLAPAHALYFAVWEAMKRQFIGPGRSGDELNSIQSGAAGICGTVRISSLFHKERIEVFVDNQ